MTTDSPEISDEAVEAAAKVLTGSENYGSEWADWAHRILAAAYPHLVGPLLERLDQAEAERDESVAAHAEHQSELGAELLATRAEIATAQERLDQQTAEIERLRAEADEAFEKGFEQVRRRCVKAEAELAAAQARAEAAEEKVQRVEALRALWNHDGQLRVGMAPGEVRNAQMAAWASDQLGRLLAAGDAARPLPEPEQPEET